MSENKFEFHFHAPVGQNIANVEHMDVHVGKDGSVQVANVEQMTSKVPFSQPKANTPAAAAKSKVGTTVTTHAFRYEYLDRHENRLVYFCQQLSELGLIDHDDNITSDDILAIFSGQPNCTWVRWMHSQAWLYYIVNQLLDRRLLTLTGSTKWKVTGSHFRNSVNASFTDWNHQHAPEDEGVLANLNHLIDLLDPKKTPVQLDKACFCGMTQAEEDAIRQECGMEHAYREKSTSFYKEKFAQTGGEYDEEE